jgi:hypothetical protein
MMVADDRPGAFSVNRAWLTTWIGPPQAASYPPASGRLVVTAVGAGEGMTLWGK